MVIRYLIRCSTCYHHLTLRIGVGHSPYQVHAFLCPECNEEITIGMKVDFEKTTAEPGCVENCQPGEEEGDIIILEPHFVIDNDAVATDRSFPWMEQFEYIKEYRKLNLPNFSDINGPLMFDAYNQLGGITYITEIWKIVKKGWSLYNNERYDLSQKALQEYKKYGYEGEITINEILAHFCQAILFPGKIKLIQAAGKCISKAVKLNKPELVKFKDYYINNLQKDHFERYFEVLNDYFKDYSEYDQTILYIKNNAPIPDGCIATSTGFRSTKMFYGNCYEAYTSNLSILACLNNIVNGREFDQFNQMTLKKYFTINKARRGQSFEDNADINIFLECLDSTLRNASHHGATKLTKHRRYIAYRSGGTGETREISYSKYLEKCGNIMFSSVALLVAELVLLQL